MTLDLDELERIEREATAGPWRSIASDLLMIRSYEYQVPHAALIAAARNALPALLAELRALRAVAEAAEHYRDMRWLDDASPMYAMNALEAKLKAWRGSR